jgi:hypothetical protein
MKALTLLLTVMLFGLVQLGSAQIAPYGVGKPSPAIDRVAVTPADMLRQDMRKLWSEHVFWTRDYAAAAIANQPDQDVAAKRLLKNQEDIGNAIAQYYGKDAGDKLTKMLKDQILIAVDLIKAAKAHDDSKFQEADRKWDRNAEDIADFLSRANPFWPKTALMDLMKMHLATTKEEVKARVTKNWEADVRAFDAVYDHILRMADALSDGIIRQFPEHFLATAD